MKHSLLLLLVLLLSFSLVKSNNFKTPNKEKGMRTIGGLAIWRVDGYILNLLFATQLEFQPTNKAEQ